MFPLLSCKGHTAWIRTYLLPGAAHSRYPRTMGLCSPSSSLVLPRAPESGPFPVAEGPARSALPAVSVCPHLCQRLSDLRLLPSLFSLDASPSLFLSGSFLSPSTTSRICHVLAPPSFSTACVCLSEHLCLPVSCFLLARCRLCISPPHLKEGTPVTLFASVLLSVVSWPGTRLLALWWKGYSRQISATFAQGHSTCCSPCPPPHPLWPCHLSF